MDSTLACLAAWMPRQRWYTGKGRQPRLRQVSSWDLDSPDDARVSCLLIADDSSQPAVLYQVPVVARDTMSVDGHDEHVIGSPEPGTTLRDGPHDPAFTAALWDLVTAGVEVRGPGVVVTGTPAASVAVPTTPMAAAVLRGEQSNTSIVYRSDAGDPPVICKVFRQVQPGRNPDIELQTALADAGSPFVPAAVGWVDGEWTDGAADPVSGSLAFAQEFLPGVQDAWRVALGSAAADEDFGSQASDLGRAVAEVHLSLTQLFPTRDAGPGDRAAIVDSWRVRLDTAIGDVPALSAHREAVEAIYARAAAAPWPPLQRIHGDLHLGQVIRVPERGWMLLDFEGEPLRPMSERVQPDLALRDLAGMLRSFDYVAGSLHQESTISSRDAVDAWARAARLAFLSGYERDTGIPASEELLDALELDKAVYEATYEARNRPAWLPIPLQAIERLVGRAAGV